MDNIFILNPTATTLDIQEAIHQRLTQLKSVVNCLLVNNQELGVYGSFGIIWSIDNLVNQLDVLCEQILQ